MTPMWRDRIFICFIYMIVFYPRPSDLSILALIFAFLNYWSLHDSNEEFILLTDINVFKTHINLYIDYLFFNWGGNNAHNVESLIMILFSASLASLSPTCSGSLTRLL